MILLFIGSLLTHGATWLYIYTYIYIHTYIHTCILFVCGRATISLFPRLTFVSRDLEGYFACLPLYLLNLLARPNFRNLPFRRSAVNDVTRVGFFIDSRRTRAGTLRLLHVELTTYDCLIGNRLLQRCSWNTWTCMYSNVKCLETLKFQG